MSAITVNTFPSINAFTSARSWVLAIIVLLHVGFFWALSNGLSIRTIVNLPKQTVIDFLPDRQEPKPTPVIRIKDVKITPVFVPRPVEPRLPIENESRTSLEQVTDVPPPPVERRARPAPAPVVVEPAIDSRIGLSEPLYPSQEIRMGHTGTVVLSVEVLPNGRVGEIRIHQSSGYPRLDESAVREARRWKLRPGTRDGVPVTAWKQIPITFRLKEAVRF